jgi:hypothetical protein
VEVRAGKNPNRARVRWFDPVTGQRRSKSVALPIEDAAAAWIQELEDAARGGVNPHTATMKPASMFGRGLLTHLGGGVRGLAIG